MEFYVERQSAGLYLATNCRIAVQFNVPKILDFASMEGDDDALGVILEIAHETLVARENATR